MSLRELLNQGSIKPHKTSKEEIANLLKLIISILAGQKET